MINGKNETSIPERYLIALEHSGEPHPYHKSVETYVGSLLRDMLGKQW